MFRLSYSNDCVISVQFKEQTLLCTQTTFTFEIHCYFLDFSGKKINKGFCSYHAIYHSVT